MNAVITACNEINQITNSIPAADIGIIRHEVPVYIEGIQAAMLEFEHLHDLKYGEKKFKDIEAVQQELKNCPERAKQTDCKALLAKCREAIADSVCTFIELAASAANKKNPSY